MNYLDKLKLALKSQDQDETLIDSFMSVESLYYINKDSVEVFSLYDFLEELHISGNASKAYFEYNNFANTLTLKGCRSLELDIVDNQKQIIFSQMKRFLEESFPEMSVMGEVRSIPVDNVIPQLEDLKAKNEHKLETYIRTMIQSMGVDLESYEDQILKLINQHVLGKFNFDIKTASEMSNFDMTKADPNVIKKQISVCIDRLLSGKDLDGLSL